MFFPVLFKRIWMLSRLCCCIAVFTLHMYASSTGIPAGPKNANALTSVHFHSIHAKRSGRFPSAGALPRSGSRFGRASPFPTSVLQDRRLPCGMMCYCVLAGPPMPTTGPHAVHISIVPFLSQALSQRGRLWV